MVTRHDLFASNEKVFRLIFDLYRLRNLKRILNSADFISNLK